MLFFEYITLGITYTALSISLFLQIICLKRKIESPRTITLTVSLLLLIISLSVSPLFGNDTTTTITTLICMVLVGTTTVLDVLNRQKHTLPNKFETGLIASASLFVTCLIIGYFVGISYYLQYVVAAYLIITVSGAMLFTRFTKPVIKFQHHDKTNRLFAIVFLILVPTYLIVHYAFEQTYDQFQFGFLLYFAFTALAVSKIYDDLKRLSLTNQPVEPNRQHFKNHGLTQREEEVANLLLKGKTYQAIASSLFISLPTVKTHASNIYRKCEVKSRSELTVLFK